MKYQAASQSQQTNKKGISATLKKKIFTSVSPRFGSVPVKLQQTDMTVSRSSVLALGRFK